MGLTIIVLQKEKPFHPYICDMCKVATRKNKFFWKSWFTGDELSICRECAYREKYGTKGMINAAKVLALTAYDLFKNKNLIEEAKKEFLEKRGSSFVYSPLIGSREPALDYRK